MAEIKRVEASESQVAEARKGVFGLAYTFPEGKTLKVKEVGFTSHSFNGTKSENASPVIFLEDMDEVIYVRALIKEHFDYQNNIVESKGTLNSYVKNMMGKTLGEVVDDLNDKIKGKELIAHRVNFMGVNRLGVVQPILFNVYDIKE